MPDITKKTKISEILMEKGEIAAEILMNSGMGCIGCPMSQQETLEQGCLAHGMDEKQINKIVEKLNKISLTEDL
jgi:hybrid cluster-associated redox disulfide protein